MPLTSLRPVAWTVITGLATVVCLRVLMLHIPAFPYVHTECDTGSLLSGACFVLCPAYALIFVHFKIHATKNVHSDFNSVQQRGCHWPPRPPLFLFFIRKGLFTYECNHVHVTNAVNSALQFTLGSEKALLCFKRIPSLSPVLEWVHVLHALSHSFYVSCWVIVLDWTVKCCRWGWTVIFITVFVFYRHYLLLLIYRMSRMHL